jgi:hypothetical protein
MHAGTHDSGDMRGHMLGNNDVPAGNGSDQNVGRGRERVPGDAGLFEAPGSGRRSAQSLQVLSCVRSIAGWWVAVQSTVFW